MTGLRTHGMPADQEPGLSADEGRAINEWRWFSSLPPSARHDLLRHARVRRYQAGDVISPRGTMTNEWLACARGAVRIGASSAAGKEIVLTYVQPGVWFAGPGLFDGGPSTHEAVAFGETTILSVAQADFAMLLSQSPALCIAVLRLQARHTRELYDALEAVNTLPLRPRLARQLALLAQRHGVPEAGSGAIRIGIRLPQAELAHLVGSSRQRVNLELKQMERAGVIRVEREGLVICDADALASP
jgi:CRP-like cAMP-binding protein